MKVSSIIFLLLAHSMLFAQNSKILKGDWVRYKANYNDGRELPNDHHGRVYQRYYFIKDNEALLIMGNTTWPMECTFAGNQLKIGPVQSFTVELQTADEIVLLDAKNKVRYFFMPTDSFTISRIIKYAYTVSASDTVFTSTIGIEPIYPKTKNDFMKYIWQSFGAADVSFEFSFVVLKDGTIGEVTVESSTNVKLNKRLVQIVKKSDKWIPGAIEGKPINVRINANITLSRR